MRLELWHITGPAFHFGRHGLGQEETREYLPSDSLWAALMARLAELHGAMKVAQLADWLHADPPVVLSSAFPRAGNVLFFPPPLQLPPSQSATESKESAIKAKKLKQVRFISERLFRKVASGGATLKALWEAGKLVALHDDKMLYERGEPLPAAVQEHGRIYAIERRPRVAVGRQENAPQIYHTGRVAYQLECGLWFAMRWLKQDVALKSLLTEALHDLGVAGLGGERNAGFGACQIEEQTGALELPDPAAEGMWVNLSRYWPREDEIEALHHAHAAYNIESVGGWIYSPHDKNQRRRAVRMIAEGAALGAVNRVAPGMVDDVRPRYSTYEFPHPVHRVGQALAVGYTAGG